MMPKLFIVNATLLNLPQEYIIMAYVVGVCLGGYGAFGLYKLKFSASMQNFSSNERLDKLILSLFNIVLSLLFIFLMVLFTN